MWQSSAINCEKDVSMTDKILRRPAVEEITGLSRSTMYRMIQRGDFPKPANIGARAVGWRESAVSEWLARLGGGKCTG